MSIELRGKFDTLGLQPTSWNAKISSVLAGEVNNLGVRAGQVDLILRQNGSQGSLRFVVGTISASSISADASFEFSADDLDGFESGKVYSTVNDSQLGARSFFQSLLLFRDRPQAGEGLGLICFIPDPAERIIDAIVAAFRSTVQDGLNALMKASESVAVVSGDVCGRHTWFHGQSTDHRINWRMFKNQQIGWSKSGTRNEKPAKCLGPPRAMDCCC